MAETEAETGTENTPTPEVPRAKKRGGARPLRIQSILHNPPPRKLPTSGAKKFFEWWNKVHEKDPDRLTGQVYRDYPVVIKKPRQGCHFHFTSPPENVDAFYADPHIGCGDYRIYLNDAKEAGKTYSLLTLKGFRNYQDYAPYLNVDELAWDDPANGDYINAMRSLGRMLGKEEHEMEQQQSGMAAAMADLSKTVTQLATQQFQRPHEPSMDGRLSAGIVDSIMQTRKMERDMLKDTLDETRKMGVVSSGDPIGQFKEVVGVVAPLLQSKSDSPVDFVSLLGVIQQQNALHLQQINELNASRIAAIEKSNQTVLEIIREQKNPAQESDLDRFLATKEKVDKLGLGGGDGDDKITRYLAIGSALLPSAAQLLQGLVTASYNFVIASRNPNAKPIPPPSDEDIRKQNEEIQKQQAGQQADPKQQAYLQFLESIKGALIKHISSPDLSGEDFADWLVNSQQNGLMIYRALKEQENAKQELANLLASHPEIWQQISGAPQTLERFLDEFLSYEENPEPEMPEGVQTIEKGSS